MALFVMFLTVSAFVFGFCLLVKVALIQDARNNINRNARYGKKLCGENGHDELVRHDGHPMSNIFMVTFGGQSNNEGISQARISRMVFKELLDPVLSADGKYLRIDNSLGEQIGYYPAENPYFDEFVRRLSRGEAINTWVYDWGYDTRYYCELKIVVYDYTASITDCVRYSL